MIEAAELETLLSDLVPIGLDESGATTRLAWTDEDERAAAWFARRAEAIGRKLERDPAGNLWACPDTPPPWWAVGSHLDSVRGGGRFDGALGVAAGFAVAERVPVAVVSFADEEGARFNTPTFGSRALVGRLDVDDAVDRVDEHGVTLGDAMAAAGVDPEGLRDAPAWLDRLAGFLELHIDQTRDLAAAHAPAGVVTRLAARLRLQVELSGRADHAGTTPREERRDALAAAARVIVRADTEAAQRLGMVFTAARMEVEPNSPTTVPSLVRLWLDARAPEPETVESWRETVALEIERVAEAAGVGLELRTAAWSPGTEFPDQVRDALLAGLRPPKPRLVCYAGHDAGVIAAARPAGMVLVRNDTGVSHSPEEEVSLDDAAVAANGAAGGGAGARAVRIPAMANVHSHAFQRDLRGIGERSERPDDDFWSWREEMYRLAEALDPDSMREVAGRVYAEMAAAGYGAVGEFHYVHHQPDGTPYEEPNAMALAVAGAAAGLTVVLLPAAYHRGGHARFRDPSVEDYLARVDALRLAGHPVGVAAHSVRAVPADWLREIARYAEAHGLVRHVHAHEQPRELEECQAEHGCSPIELLDRTGFLGERTTIVHGIHVSDRDIALVAETGTIVATCPTTEGNLGDGHFPALRWRDAGVRLAIGSDSNVVVDPFEELRELETGARRERRTRHALLAEAGDLWGAVVRRTASPRSASRTRARWPSTSITRGCAASRRRTSCGRWPPARRPIPWRPCAA